AAAPAADSPESIGDLRDRIAETERKKLELVKTLALIFEARGDQEKAIAYTYQAFMLDATDEALATKLLELLRTRDRWSEMIPIYERLIDERPGRSQQYLLELGTCHFKVGDADRALEVLDRYRKEYAEYEATYLKLASVLADNGHMPKAAAILEEAVAGDFKGHYKMHWQLGIVYVELGETLKAIGAYEAALDLVEPGSDRNAINSRLISLYKKADRIDEVIAKREREIEEIDARLVKLYWAEAEAHEKAERFAEAVEFYRKIVALAP
ncbi:unnamed protein product, partial [marine sediment metagenome]